MAPAPTRVANDPAPSPPDRGEVDPPWRIAVEILGALAGVTIVLYLVGGLIYAARLRALGLPIDAGVALVPNGSLVVAGVRALWLGLVLAVGVSLIIRVLDPVHRGPARRRRLMIAAGAVVLLVFTPVLLLVLQEPLTKPQRLVFTLFAVGAAAVAIALLVRARSHRGILYPLAAVVLVTGMVLHGASQWLPPTELDFVSVRLQSGDVTDGYYLASDSSTVYLVPNVGEASIRTVTALPRKDVAAMTITLEKAAVRPIGTRLSSALTGRYASLPRGDPERERRHEDLVRYAARLRTDPGWLFPPTLPVAAIDFLEDNYNDFSPNAVGSIPDRAERVPTGVLLADPHLYVGRPIVFRAVVEERALESAVPGGERRLLIVRAPGSETAFASCSLSRPRPFDVAIGNLVDLRATVIAWGRYNIRSDDPIQLTAMACAGLRVIEQPGRPSEAG